MSQCHYCKQEMMLGNNVHSCPGKRDAERPLDAATCSPDDLQVRDAFAVEVFITDYSGQRYSGSNFADIKSARAWLTLQPNRDSLRVAITAKFLLENAGGMARELAAQDSESPNDING